MFLLQQEQWNHTHFLIHFTIEYEKIIDAFYKYLLIGGMPESVQSFVLTNDLKRVNLIQEKIDTYYRKDITQYAPANQRIHLETIYRLIGQELNKKNKRFSLGEVGEGYKIKNIQDDFMWLKKAGVTIPVINIDEPKSPLEISCNNRLVKIYHCDVGILCYNLMDTNIQMKLFTKEKNINYGAIFENFVAQELYAHVFDEIYYFNSKKQGEVDFVIEYGGNVVPLKVKSGKDFKIHSALTNLLSDKYDIPFAIVLCNNNVQKEDKILYLPIYMTMFIKKLQPKSTKIKLDLSSLDV